MRDREQLEALIKTFEVNDSSDDRAGAKNVGLIGGDIGRVIKDLPPLLSAENVVDPFRDPESVQGFLEIAKQASMVRLEIGSARGTFALAMGERHPDEVFLASEVRGAHCKAILSKRDRRGIKNLHVMLGDVRIQLPGLLSSGPIMDEIYILFPDPWWKKKHWKRRLFQPGFLEFLATALKPGGTLILKTDVQPYREEVERLGRECELYEQWPEDKTKEFLEGMPHTRREKELSEANLGIYGLIYTRLDKPTPISSTNQDSEKS